MNVTALVDSRDCAAAGCPNEADGRDGLCRYCRRQVARRPRLSLVHSREGGPVYDRPCREVPGCHGKAVSDRGRYANVCAEHKHLVSERLRAAGAKLGNERATLAAVPPPVELEPVPEPIDAGPLLEELLAAQPAYELAEEAAAIVKDRMAKYGPPVENHGCTAELWAAWLHRRFGVRLELTAADVCWLNVLQKLSREANQPAGDNRLDVMGFAINAELSIRA